MLRDYQERIVQAVLNEFKEVCSTLVVAPTGCGKTQIFVEVIKRMQPARALILAHREELIWQARNRVESFAGLDCAIEMGELAASDSLLLKTNVVVATVQTMNAPLGDRTRKSRFDPADFGLVVADECHHYVATSFRNTLHYFKQNPSLKILGVTATPDRADEEALGQIFDSVAADYEILDAIHDGWLVPVTQEFVVVHELDLSNVRTTAGDLNGADLAAVMEAEANMQRVASSSIEIIGNRRAIAFTASVAQAEMLCNIFNRHRPGMAAWICGKTDKEERRKVLRMFSTGDVQAVVNCNVLTEGFDNPGVEVIIMARPTKSRSLYAQMAGRSMRPLPGIVDAGKDADTRRDLIALSDKPSCLIVDFVGNSGRHKLMSSADILGGNVSERALERALRKAKQAGKPVDMAKELDDAEKEIEQMDKARAEEEARKLRLIAKASYTRTAIDPFDALNIFKRPARGWDTGKPLSEKMRSLLIKQGVNPEGMTFTQGRQLVAEFFRRWNNKLCTIKQAALLKKFGYDPKNITMQQASQIITSLRANNWRRPNEQKQEKLPF